MVVNDNLPGLRVGTYNVNGLGNQEKRLQVFNWLKNKEEDIICLQETHSTPSAELSWERSWDGKIIFNHGTSNSTGVAVLVKPNVNNLTITKINHLVEGRATLVELELGSEKFCIANIYAPNNDDIGFLETVFHYTLGRPRDDQVIYGGTGTRS